MSESVPAKSSTMDVLPPGRPPHEYGLTSDLARMSLPSEYRDSNRKLAWANSICFAFLVVGLVGLKAPKVIRKPLSEVVEVVPVVFTPPEEQPKVQPEIKPDEPTEPQDTPIETPQVAVVVAAADPSTVAFAVPVEGAVTLAPAHLASPPPPVISKPPPPAAPSKFDPNAKSGGTTPPPDYPGIAQRNHYQGTVVIDFSVDDSGAITSANVRKSSGFPVLDEAALKVVKTRWHLNPGAPRAFYWECTFQLK